MTRLFAKTGEFPEVPAERPDWLAGLLIALVSVVLFCAGLGLAAIIVGW